MIIMITMITMIIRFGGNFLRAFRFLLFILRLSKEAVKRNSSGNNLFRRVSKFIEAMTVKIFYN